MTVFNVFCLIYVAVFMCGQFVLNLLPLESNRAAGIYTCLALLEYVHLLLNVKYLLHLFGDVYTIHTIMELAM